MYILDNDQLRDYERMIAEGAWCGDYYSPNDCITGYHVWKWYEGFHLERYWFCEKCDEKRDKI